jgi:hypothetical protein
MSKPAEIALWGLDVAEMTVSRVTTEESPFLINTIRQSLVYTLKSGQYTPPTASIFPCLLTYLSFLKLKALTLVIRQSL